MDTLSPGHAPCHQTWYESSFQDIPLRGAEPPSQLCRLLWVAQLGNATQNEERYANFMTRWLVSNGRAVLQRSK